jgi:hypothetical protein
MSIMKVRAATPKIAHAAEGTDAVVRLRPAPCGQRADLRIPSAEVHRNPPNLRSQGMDVGGSSRPTSTLHSDV